jgi:copper chaperone
LFSFFILYATDKGVDKVDIDLPAHQVLVTSSLDADTLLETIKKTGKETSYVGIRD